MRCRRPDSPRCQLGSGYYPGLIYFYCLQMEGNAASIRKKQNILEEFFIVMNDRICPSRSVYWMEDTTFFREQVKKSIDRCIYTKKGTNFPPLPIPGPAPPTPSSARRRPPPGSTSRWRGTRGARGTSPTCPPRSWCPPRTPWPSGETRSPSWRWDHVKNCKKNVK